MQEYAPKGIVSNQGNEKWLTKDNNIAIMLNQGPGNLVKQAYAQGLEDRIGIVQEFKNEDGKGRNLRMRMEKVDYLLVVQSQLQKIVKIKSWHGNG